MFLKLKSAEGLDVCVNSENINQFMAYYDPNEDDENLKHGVMIAFIGGGVDDEGDLIDHLYHGISYDAMFNMLTRERYIGYPNKSGPFDRYETR